MKGLDMQGWEQGERRQGKGNLEGKSLGVGQQCLLRQEAAFGSHCLEGTRERGLEAGEVFYLSLKQAAYTEETVWGSWGHWGLGSTACSFWASVFFAVK